MELKGNLKSGVIKNFSSILNDGSRLSASKIIRDIENGDRLEKVIYTKCEICEDSPDEFPIWQLRALKSKRNVEEGRIEYNHVILDAYGFPLFYFPAISHSDPSIKKSSGFLSPKFKNNSVLGPTFTQPYYYVLSESSDITFMPTMTYNEGPILGANYRKLGSKSSTFISGSFTKGSMQKTQGEEEDSSKLRGHININSVERISKKWIAGINFIRATDSTYLPRYRLENIGSSGTLTQRVHFSGYEEGFFSEIEGLYFQPMDASKSNRHVPLIFPNTKTLWTNVDQEGFAREIALNTTSIARASGSNSQRISLESKWTKERILNSGHIITTQISGRTDLYRDRKTDLSQTSGDPGSNKNIRLVPKLETTWRLPSKGDLLNLMSATPKPNERKIKFGEEERIKMSRLRQTIAKRLKQAQENAAMLTTFNEVDMTNIIEMRKENQEDFQKRYGIKLGFMSFFVKACVVGLKNFPAINAEVDDNEIIYKNYYNISFAVGTEKGLVVPVLRNADELSFADIEKNIISVSEKARNGKLTIEDLQGGTFTISNGGVYGSMLSTPILNPPQSGVLGMHNIVERPIAIDGEVKIRSIMYLALSYDHRIIAVSYTHLTLPTKA